MRILCISYEYPPVGGGGATVCQEIAEAFVRAGHDLDVVTCGMKDLPEYEERGGVHVYRVACLRRLRHHSTAAELLTQIIPSYLKALELIRRRTYDIIHCHFVVPSGIVAYLLKKRTGLPYVITAHGSDVPGYNLERFEQLHRLIQPVWSRIVRASSAVTVPSQYLEVLIRRHTDKSVDFIPNTFDPPPAPVWATRRNRVLVVSRMVERKGIQFLIRALAKIETDWEFWIAGDGPYLEKLQELAAGVGAQVKFLGFVNREALPQIYRSAKIFVFPSLRENCPMVLLEAMAAGCAVVTTSASGCAAVVGNAAIQVPPGDVEGLRNVLGQLLADEPSIDRLRALSHERAARFSTSQIVAEYEALFRRCITLACDRGEVT